jgi:hyperosmotically inducible protein
MNTTHTVSATSFSNMTLRTTVLVAAMMLGTQFAQAATDSTATTPSTAASNVERVVSDSWITTKVKSEILENSVSKAFKVSVKTKHGAVTLKGKLPNQDAIDLVKMIAEKVKGVKSVDVSGLSIGS